MKKSARCPVCKSDETTFLYISYNRHGRHDINKENTYQVKRCKICDIVFLSDIKIDAAYYKKYYDIGYYDGGMQEYQSTLSKMVRVLENWSVKQKEKYILKYAPMRTPLTVLDVGCGNGKFLESLDSRKFKKFGIEINREGAKLSREKGLPVYESDVTELDFKQKKFDVITLWHVLEHLTDPIAVYKKINRILKPDGIVVFATPNTGSLGSRIGKQKWFHLDSPRHLILFNKKSIEYLCKRTGLSLIAIPNEFYDFPLDLFWSIQGSSLKYLLYPLYPLAKYLDREALTVICKKV